MEDACPAVSGGLCYQDKMLINTQATSLTTTNHDRDVAGLKYVYPVISRRAGGLSIGINFNTNNACNWRCIYCQVPNLSKGAAPNLDLHLLADELRFFLKSVQSGDFYRQFQVGHDQQVIKDIAISGNGEPTSAKQFAQAVNLIGDIAAELKVLPDSHFVLISNGSLMHQANVKEGLKYLKNFGGEVWYKFDSATQSGRALHNNAGQSLQRALENIKVSSELCTTKLQSCFFDYRGQGLLESERQAYLGALANLKATTAVDEVLLYTLARPSLQPEAQDLTALPFGVLELFAEDIRKLGYKVSVSY